MLEKKAADQHLAANFVNGSISGDTTSGGRARLPALMTAHQPDILVIELGANDGLRGLPVNQAEANLRAMIELAQKNKAQVLLIGMRMPPNYGRDYTERFFGMYKALSVKYKAPLVPFMLEGVADKPALFQADRLHPRAEAHPTILANIWPAFSGLVKPR